MTDDDRRLADRLRRYESRVPVHDEEPVVRPRPVPWAALAGVAAVLVLAVVLATAVLQREPRVGEPSPSADASASAPAGLRELAEIQSVDLSADGRQLDIAFLGGVCHDFEAETDRTDEVLEVTVFATMRVLPSGEECPAAEEVHELRLDFDPPFAGTIVRDGTTGREFSVAIAAASTTPSPAPESLSPQEPGIAAWQLAATFGTDDQQPTFAFDVTTWGDGYAAVGTRFDRFVNDCCGPTPGQPVLWTSATGSTWEESPLVIDLPATEVGTDPSIEHILTRADGRLMVLNADSASSTTATLAWVSDDGSSWTATELGIGDLAIMSEAQGPGGYVLVGTTDRGAQQVWYAVDGIIWELVHEVPPEAEVQLESVDAGPEGFVIVGASRLDADRPYALASSDGRIWLRADASQPAFQTSDFPIDVAALGTDWVATGFGAPESEQRPVVWRSANGLEWTRDVGPQDPNGRDSYYASDLAGAGGVVIISPAVAAIAGPYQFPTWAWSSTDGITWAQLPTDMGYVYAMATNGASIVAVGTIGRGDQAAMWSADVVPDN